MKKKIIFTMGSLGIGGAEKSLVTLLSEIDYEKYEVDLMLFNPKGEFKAFLPKEVNVKYPSKDYIKFDMDPIKSVLYFLKKFKIKLLILNVIYLIKLSFYRFILKKEYIGWGIRRKALKPIEEKYDIAIGFLEKKCTYFIVDKIKADKKIGWVHTDYSSIDYNRKDEEYYFNKLDYIITVSENCKETLINIFPEIREKVRVMQNIVSPNFIKDMASQEVNYCRKNKIIISTVGRLIKAKGIDNAIIACKKIIDKGYDVSWIVIGEGAERESLSKQVESLGIKENFVLLGSKVNPYPYIKECDIYIQPSRWEGFGISVLEAKILGKPIIVSDIPEFREQITNLENGLVYKDIDELVNEIIMIIENKQLANMLIKNLKKCNYDNSQQINILLELID